MLGPWPTARAIKGAKIAARLIITIAASRGDGDFVVAEARQHQLGRSPTDDYVPARGPQRHGRQMCWSREDQCRRGRRGRRQHYCSRSLPLCEREMAGTQVTDLISHPSHEGGYFLGAARLEHEGSASGTGNRWAGR